jgi:hypothetical protein
MEVGIRVKLHGTDGDDVGVAHAPAPVEVGDVLALADGSPWRVMSVIAVYNAGDFAALCMVEPVPIV